MEQTEEQKIQYEIVAIDLAIRKLEKKKDKLLLRLEDIIEEGMADVNVKE